MTDRFSRTELLIGKAALDRLKAARVAIFGVGGVGGYAAEALARSGVGAIDLIDDDKICITNINRQIYALSSTVGKHKTDVAAERIKDINPDCKVTTYKIFYLPETTDEIDFINYDYVIDAVDTVTAKLLIAENAESANVPVISAMGAGNKLDPTAFKVADIYKTSGCPLARVMRTECKKRGIKGFKAVYSEEKATRPPAGAVISCKRHCVCPAGTVRKCTARRDIPASISFVPPVVGFIMAAEVVKDLIKGDNK